MYALEGNTSYMKKPGMAMTYISGVEPYRFSRCEVLEAFRV